MSDRNDKQLNQDNELAKLRSLIGDADSGSYSLDDILTEYSSHKLPSGVVSLASEEQPDNLIPFPGTQVETEPEEATPIPSEEIPDAPDETDAEEETTPDKETEDEDRDEGVAPEADDRPDNVVDFPQPLSLWQRWLQALSQKADRYAEEMFSEEGALDTEQARRAQRYLPGVDTEDAPPVRRRRERRPDPAEPDTPARELYEQYDNQLNRLSVPIVLLSVFLLLALYLLLEPLLPIPSIPHPADPTQPLLTHQLNVWLSAGLLLASLLTCLPLVADVVRRAARLRLGMDTMLILACFATLADALTMQILLPRDQLPYCAVNILGLLLLAHGQMHRLRGLRLACRTAAAASDPLLITLDKSKWNSKDTYTKHSGQPVGFGSQIQADDGAQQIMRKLCPFLIPLCILLSLLSSVGCDRPQRLLWALSATFSAACSLSAPLIFARPFHKLERKLTPLGAALAGWPGAADSRRDCCILLTDYDLFPPGSVTPTGVKVFGDHRPDRVVSYVATLIRAAGGGLERPFHDLMRAEGGTYRTIERFGFHESGGLSATIRGQEVLVGSNRFMGMSDIELPPGLNHSLTVFCAIDGELAGLIPLHYGVNENLFPALDSLLYEKITPVLATRDFNLIPRTLEHRFNIASFRMDFPQITRRWELSDPEQEHSQTLTGILRLEGIHSLAATVVGARRLRLVVRAGSILASVSGALGALLAGYLTAVGAFVSLSPLNLLVFLLLWLLPFWLISGWTDQY